MLKYLKVNNLALLGSGLEFIISPSSTFAEIVSDYKVLDISGLNPVKASISAMNLAALPGSKFAFSKLDERNIVLTLGYKDAAMVRDGGVQRLRETLERFMAPETKISMTFISEEESYSTFRIIEGTVETFESPYFTREPVVQVSIRCFNPIYDSGPKSLTLNTSALLNNSFSIQYDGSYPTGLSVLFQADKAHNKFGMQRIVSGSVESQLLYSGPVNNGDSLRINTNPGSKSVSLNGPTTGNVQKNTLGLVSVTNSWPYLKRGVNQFKLIPPTTGLIGGNVILSWTEKFVGL